MVVGAICYSTICIGTHTGQIAVQWLCRDWSAIEKQMHIISLYTLSPFLFGCSYQSEKVRGMGVCVTDICICVHVCVKSVHVCVCTCSCTCMCGVYLILCVCLCVCMFVCVCVCVCTPGVRE